jgi:hypothetical protein
VEEQVKAKEQGGEESKVEARKSKRDAGADVVPALMPVGLG